MVQGKTICVCCVCDLNWLFCNSKQIQGKCKRTARFGTNNLTTYDLKCDDI